MNAIVIINEQHTLLADQEKVLNREFPNGWELKKVPAAGWSLDEIDGVAALIRHSSATVVFASPIPALLAILSWHAGWSQGWAAANKADPALAAQLPRCRVFHNDHRVAKELPGGKIIHTVAPDGWVLVG